VFTVSFSPRLLKPNLFAVARAKGAVNVAKFRKKEGFIPRKKNELQIAECEKWSDTVRERFLEGWKFLRNSEIAKERGWPVSVIDHLLERGLVSFPLLPWEIRKTGRRGIAFRVDKPEISKETGISTIPVGYHQRFIIQDRKSWIYVPYIPSKVSSPFQEVLLEEGRKVAAFPFCLSTQKTMPERIVILEGQWDAITFFHASGWFNSSVESESVLGIRGSQSVSLFLNAYEPIIHQTESIMLIPDNDLAGLSWIHGYDSFVNKLQQMTDARVLIQTPKGNGETKDFNDYFRINEAGGDRLTSKLSGNQADDGKTPDKAIL
jgi:hypothetical protein